MVWHMPMVRLPSITRRQRIRIRRDGITHLAIITGTATVIATVTTTGHSPVQVSFAGKLWSSMNGTDITIRPSKRYAETGVTGIAPTIVTVIMIAATDGAMAVGNQEFRKHADCPAAPRQVTGPGAFGGNRR